MRALILVLAFVSAASAEEERMAGTFQDLLAPALPTFFTSGGGKSRVTVDGCSKQARFTAKFIADPEKSPLSKATCHEFFMHPKLVQFLNENFEACVEVAGDRALGHGTLKADLQKGGNELYHDGCIGNEAHRHQKGGSWHNDGLAIDIVAIKVGSRLFKYEDTVNPKTEEDRRADSFFNHFRRCWSSKVEAYDDSCIARGPGKSGSVGKEDKRHEHHLHISLPCRSLYKGTRKLASGWMRMERSYEN